MGLGIFFGSIWDILRLGSDMHMSLPLVVY